MNPPKIDSYRFGQVVIDGDPYTKDVIILPERVIGGWWRKEGHALHPADLEVVIEARTRCAGGGEGSLQPDGNYTGVAQCIGSCRYCAREREHGGSLQALQSAAGKI